jgi:hypothetical protein
MIDIGTLRITALTGPKGRMFLLRSRQVDSDVTDARPRAVRFPIRSPSVVARVSGTRFRVRYDSDDRSTRVAVLNGSGVDAMSANDVASPGRPLPPPELANPDRTQDWKDVAVDLLPFVSAHAFRVSAPHTTFGGTLDRDYFVQFSSIDQNELEGLRQIFAFERRQFSVATRRASTATNSLSAGASIARRP